MKVLESVRSLVFLGSLPQARAFAATCAERASVVLLRSLDLAGRTGDLEACRAAADLLWSPHPQSSAAAPAPVPDLLRHLHTLPELHGPGAVAGLDVLARTGARALYSALVLAARPDGRGGPGVAGGAVEPSFFARDFARELYFHGAKRLPAEEDGAQDRDVALIMSLSAAELSSSLPSLRAKAAEEGRYRLVLAVTGCTAEPPGPALDRARTGLRHTA
ncbi:hypothetical protein [Streptomyces sp. NBC_00102]|uniref:hypothetical protein n=1 Tax=Streptomyces sp. NBC_00102 TaxID=2975652 RepID=UPI002256ECF8|nr:hypothetical protein [Streptomyces sp. NBC_00102]MCX5399408.1 hypothetical protein [Streptomyces sp. NBC_00102]